MSARVTWAIGRRVLWQIRRDPRTIALLLAVPVFLLVLLKYVFAGRPSIFRTIGVPLCGLFPFIVMFLIASIAMLRERTSGTLERQMTLPMSRLDLLLGYGIAFGLLAAIQAVVVCTVGFLALGLDAAHGAWLVVILAIGNALLGMALGLAVSAFAHTEFQAVQFMPALIFPQLILCGLFVARSEMGTSFTGSLGRSRSPTHTTHSPAPANPPRSAAGSPSTCSSPLRPRWLPSTSAQPPSSAAPPDGSRLRR
jgi:ABC-2 type transport system permease protein